MKRRMNDQDVIKEKLNVVIVLLIMFAVTELIMAGAIWVAVRAH